MASGCFSSWGLSYEWAGAGIWRSWLGLGCRRSERHSLGTAGHPDMWAGKGMALGWDSESHENPFLTASAFLHVSGQGAGQHQRRDRRVKWQVASGCGRSESHSPSTQPSQLLTAPNAHRCPPAPSSSNEGACIDDRSPSQAATLGRLPPAPNHHRIGRSQRPRASRTGPDWEQKMQQVGCRLLLDDASQKEVSA